uniref:Uncharacterized protein n=1 Tax=Arundo donax TaxID=35708 RepID=A0A0A9EUR7_ARUDO
MRSGPSAQYPRKLRRFLCLILPKISTSEANSTSVPFFASFNFLTAI